MKYDRKMCGRPVARGLKLPLVLWVLLVSCLVAGADNLVGDGKEVKRKAEFVPTSAYETQVREGWTVHVNRALMGERAELGANALKLLEIKLNDIVRALPASACRELQKVPIWLGVDDGHAPCAEYHPSRGWLKNHGYNPDKAKSVEIGNAQRFINWSKGQPSMILHELAHAYHDQVLSFGHEAIREAYKAAVKSGDYDAILHCSGKRQRAYAMTDSKEYFAEATEAYFGTNDMYPFVRAELIHHDSTLAKILKDTWTMAHVSK